MPCFETHRKVNYFLSLVGCFTLYYFNVFNFPIMLFFCIGFIIGTELITPDLDISSTPSERCGVMWLPYRILFKHGQSSHSLFFGAIGRMVYLTVLIIILIALIGWLLKNPDLLMQVYEMVNWIVVLLLVFGIWVANAIHILLDKVS